jgi:hypothetical protein
MQHGSRHQETTTRECKHIICRLAYVAEYCGLKRLLLGPGQHYVAEVGRAGPAFSMAGRTGDDKRRQEEAAGTRRPPLVSGMPVLL